MFKLNTKPEKGFHYERLVIQSQVLTEINPATNYKFKIEILSLH